MPATESAIAEVRDAVNAAGDFTVPPKSWSYFFFGGCVLASLVIAAGALTIQFLHTRPFNLRSQTTYLVKEAEKALLRNYVAEENLRLGTPEIRRDDGASWFFHRIEADLPAHVNPSGLVNLLKDAMIKERVQVLEEPTEGRDRHLRLQLADRDFASVILIPAVAAAVVDVRNACQEIADALEKALLEAGLSREGMVREIPVDHAEENVLWISTRFRVSLPASITAEGLRAQIGTALLSKEAEVYAGALTQGAVTLHIAYAGKLCAEVVCLLTDIVAPAPSTVASGSPPSAAPAEIDGEIGAMLPSLEELPLDSMGHDEAAPIPMRREAAPAAMDTAKVAIILDDGGFGGPVSEEILNLDPGLTLAILPNTPHAAELAAAASAKGFEVMLHMPMETHGASTKAFPGELSTAMPEADLERLTREALAQVPGAVGVNNHTGSKFAEDETRLASFMKVLKENQLYFVDSRTLATTKAFAVAQSLGIPAAERDIFLDNDSDPAKITDQLDALVAKAKSAGQAIGIGHFRPGTGKVLAEVLPKLAASGVKLVHASELVQ